ncbi:MAG: hypothetical protein J6L23_04185 [Clostridia bacterium]|nr:hypothetical protein [Clostridia bacterium]
MICIPQKPFFGGAYHNLNTLTWNGRQLSSIAMPNNQSINFKYNSDGIRTYKYFIDNDSV